MKNVLMEDCCKKKNSWTRKSPTSLGKAVESTVKMWTIADSVEIRNFFLDYCAIHIFDFEKNAVYYKFGKQNWFRVYLRLRDTNFFWQNVFICTVFSSNFDKTFFTFLNTHFRNSLMQGDWILFFCKRSVIFQCFAL